jgi:hypothetical protein
VLAVLGLEQRQQRAGGVDRLLDLRQVGLGALGQARLAGAEVDQRHDGLQQHVVDG